MLEHRTAAGSQLIITSNLLGAGDMRPGWERIGSRIFGEKTGLVRVVWSEAESYRLRRE